MTASSGIQGIEKLAFRAAAQRVFSRFAPGLGPALTRATAPLTQAAGQTGQAIRSGLSKVTTPLSRLGERAEQGISRGVGSVLGPEGEAISNRLLKGTAGEIGRQAVGGAVALPLLMGGIDAAMAEEGQRGKAFTSNLGRYALEGATWGGLSGAIGHPFRNLRRSAVTQAAQRRGLAPGAVDAAMKQDFGANLKSMVTGKGIHPGAGANRSLAAMGAVGQIGQVGSEWVVPEAIMGSLNPEEAAKTPPAPRPYPPAQYAYPSSGYAYPPSGYTRPPAQQTKHAEQEQFAIPPSLIGAATGGVSTGLLMDALNTRGYLPAGGRGKVMNRLLPALGSVGGAYAGSQLFKPPPPKPDPIQKSLTNVDFDKLLRYYKKRED